MINRLHYSKYKIIRSTTRLKSEEIMEEATILLIGSTGNGKSTLGNFLLDPTRSHLCSDDKIFSMAKGNLPETKKVKTATKIVKFSECDELKLTVIDTPGLNENPERDLEHMIQIVEELRNTQVCIKACVLVVKFNSKIDTQYIETVHYYSKLLPSLFEKNVVVVMTDYATDDRSIELRKIQEIDVEREIFNTQKAIVERGGLTYDPTVFLIDSLPIGKGEQSMSMNTRDAFLQYIAQLDPYPEALLLVAKTRDMKAKDTEKVSLYQGEITGYNDRLKEANEGAKECLNLWEETEKLRMESEKKSNVLSSRVALVNRDDLVVAESWNLEEKWKFLQTLEREYNLTSRWKVRSVKQWTNGKCTWHHEEQTDYHIKGRIKGKFMRGLYASLTLETTMKDKYEDDIRQCQDDLTAAKNASDSLTNELSRIEAKYETYFEDLKLLQRFIADRKVNIDELSCEYITLEEAKQRLHDLYQSRQDI